MASNDQKGIRFFTINHMAFRHVEKPYKTCRKWRTLRSPECSNLGGKQHRVPPSRNKVFWINDQLSQPPAIAIEEIKTFQNSFFDQ